MSPPRRQWRAPVAVAYVTFILIGVSAGVAGVLLPAQIRDYGLDKATIGITFWEGREVAERALPLRMQFLERIATVASVQIDEIEAFDVATAQPVSRQAD